MAYPTPAQIDAAVPVAGTPSRALTNAVLRALAAGPAAANITDATTVGRSVLTAATAAAARTAIGAVALGTTATTAKAGNYVPAWTEITGKPATYTPEIGTTATTAAAGNHTHGIATSTNPGFMSADDKAKLDALPAGGGTFTPTAAPVITIGDPVDDENVQASFDAIVNALKAVGVFT